MSMKMKKDNRKYEAHRIAKSGKKKQTKHVAGLVGNEVDYSTYHMNMKERLAGFGIGFVIGMAIVYMVTHTAAISACAGVIGGLLMQKPYKNRCMDKRKKELLFEFRDLMESLVSSYSAGSNPMEAFGAAYEDMVNLYGAESTIAREVHSINTGLANGFTITALLSNFAERSGLEDIQNFADVFSICYQRGGDMRKVLFDTRMVIGEKIEMEQEMKVQLRSNMNELKILIIVPVIIDFMTHMNVASSAGGGMGARFVAVVLFALAYGLGRYSIQKSEKAM